MAISKRHATFLLLFLITYTAIYAAIRAHRLSYGFVEKSKFFTSPEAAAQWSQYYTAQYKENEPLDFSGASLLYLIFWPAIQLDSGVSGREVESPFWDEPYALVPIEPHDSQQPPPGDRPKAPPK